MKIRYHIQTPFARPPIMTFTREELLSIETQAIKNGEDGIAQLMALLITELSKYS